MAYLLSGSGREPKHHLQLHSVTGGPAPPSIMPSPLLTLKNQAHIQRLSQTGLSSLTFSARTQIPCHAFPLEQLLVAQSYFLQRAILSGSKPLPAHIPSSVGSAMPILVWAFPLQNMSVTSPVCDACIVKSLQAVLPGLRHLF